MPCILIVILNDDHRRCITTYPVYDNSRLIRFLLCTCEIHTLALKLIWMFDFFNLVYLLVKKQGENAKHL